MINSLINNLSFWKLLFIKCDFMWNMIPNSKQLIAVKLSFGKSFIIYSIDANITIQHSLFTLSTWASTLPKKVKTHVVCWPISNIRTDQNLTCTGIGSTWTNSAQKLKKNSASNNFIAANKQDFVPCYRVLKILQNLPRK